jgi:hypothetical protein
MPASFSLMPMQIPDIPAPTIAIVGTRRGLDGPPFCALAAIRARP